MREALEAYNVPSKSTVEFRIAFNNGFLGARALDLMGKTRANDRARKQSCGCARDASWLRSKLLTAQVTLAAAPQKLTRVEIAHVPATGNRRAVDAATQEQEFNQP